MTLYYLSKADHTATRPELVNAPHTFVSIGYEDWSEASKECNRFYKEEGVKTSIVTHTPESGIPKQRAKQPFN